MATTLDYNVVDWKSLVEYDESSPSCLRWKVCRNGVGTASPKYPGDIAGTLIRKNKTSNYSSYKVAYEEAHYASARIIYILFHGRIPSDKVIDHIDRDSINNKILNLRLIDEVLNTRNLSKKCNNNSGATGVSYSESSGYGYWSAECSYKDGDVQRRVRKQFSVQKLGYDLAFNLACQWRKSTLLALIGEGVGFTESHGT